MQTQNLREFIWERLKKIVGNSDQDCLVIKSEEIDRDDFDVLDTLSRKCGEWIAPLFDNQKTVEVGKDQYIDWDEVWCKWFRCNNCCSKNLCHGYSYCPNCGVKLKWTGRD